MPQNFENYHEPFAGSAAIFLNLWNSGRISKKYYLSDTNPDLIDAFVAIRDDVDSVIKILKKYKNEQRHYYKIRSSKPRTLVGRAARLIYLNRTCFNGIYRVNSKGVFNVPYSGRQYKELFDFNNLRCVSCVLAHCFIQCEDFEVALSRVQKGDLVFLDPPYTVSHDNNGFIKYNQKLFSWSDQKRLASAINRIVQKKAYFVLTNAYHNSIADLFNNYGTLKTLGRPSTVGGSVDCRRSVMEYVISNNLEYTNE